MVINIESLNKKMFKLALHEEMERQTMNQNMFKRQIERGSRFDGDEELIAELDRLKVSFNKILRKRKPIFEISDEEFMFLERMIKNQTVISNSRIEDWQPGGMFERPVKLRYLATYPDKTEEDWEKLRLEAVQLDIDIKECLRELSNILGIEYDESLHV